MSEEICAELKAELEVLSKMLTALVKEPIGEINKLLKKQIAKWISGLALDFSIVPISNIQCSKKARPRAFSR